MNISVIIPVYNCKAYLEKAVSSALEQKEVAEVLLIDDKSKDDSGKIAKTLSGKHPDRVRYLEHPDKQNHGAGESRNQGIREAKSECLAFLDGDDYYLPDRFKKSMELFYKHPEIDGVYEAVENVFENDQVKERFVSKRPNKYKQGPLAPHLNLYTLDKPVKPEELFESLIKGENGFFHFNGLVIKKSVIDKTGYLNPSMELAQDTEFFLRLAYAGKLIHGSLEEPVAVRRVHEENRVWDKMKVRHFQVKLFKVLLKWLKIQPDSKNAKQIVLKQYVRVINFNSFAPFNLRWQRIIYEFHYCLLRVKYLNGN